MATSTGPGGQPNGIIDTDDLMVVLNGWGMCPSPPATCPGDIAPQGNPNGYVNVDDLLAVTNNYGACDHDEDGMPDWWEVQYSLDPYANDGASDADMDGVTNAEEFALGTSPTSSDSDGDGVRDGQEVNQGTNPADDSDNGEPNPDDCIFKGVILGGLPFLGLPVQLIWVSKSAMGASSWIRFPGGNCGGFRG